MCKVNPSTLKATMNQNGAGFPSGLAGASGKVGDMIGGLL
jgi:hypothetical protein